uniref:Uncharacterized protein n=1 Tax=Romanomermis culicivorax TaxID=13658 RepID=A0A915HRQ5_ROMCU
MVTIASSPPAKDQATDQTSPAAAQNTLPAPAQDTLRAPAQDTSPAAAMESPVVEPMAVHETLCPVIVDVSIIEESPFPMAVASWSPKLGILREIHPCGGLVIDFPGQEPISADSYEEEI